MPGTKERVAVNVGWLIRLRWVAVFGQLLMIIGATVILNISLLVWPLLVVIGLTVLSNLVLIYWSAQENQNPENSEYRAFDQTLGWVMTMDMLSLATLLYVTGGPTNPFLFFFFVNLSLSAVVLDRNWAWTLNLVSIVCFAGLLFAHIPIDELNIGLSLLPISEKGDWSLTQLGLLVAFATCSSVIVYFMTRVTGALRQHELDLRAAQESRSRDEKLEALGTLAAGAAHELATPLTTIALVAKDVEKSLREKQEPADDDLIEDVGLIRQELDRCKSILDRMASHAGETVGEMMQVISVSAFFEDVRQGLTEGANDIQVSYDQGSEQVELELPVAALSQAIRGLVQNALDASDPGQPVDVQISQSGKQMIWEIRDHGTGMSEEVLRRVSEPFFTTKQPGKGMGLGVFLARNVIERLNGSVEFRSGGEDSAVNGTIVTLVLPCIRQLNQNKVEGSA